MESDFEHIAHKGTTEAKMKFSKAISLLLATESVTAFMVTKPTKPSFVQKSKAASPKTIMKGLLDEIMGDDYNLMASSSETEVNMNDAYEVFLGELVFSTNDPRIDIMNKYELAADPEFIEWLDKKVEISRDPDERIALRDLYDIIVDVKQRVELSKLAEERKAQAAAQTEEERLAAAEAEAEAGRKMSNADVLRKASAIDTANIEKEAEQIAEKKSFYEEELTPEIRMSYESTLKQLLPPYKPGDTVSSVVFANYDKFDAQFVKVLNERSSNGDEDSTALLEALAIEQSKRMTAATESLRNVLSLGDPMRMEGAVVKLAREGKIDESFLLLLEANETQARDAGAQGPADLMRKLRMRAADEKDKQQSSKEIRLIRKLLRAADAPEREKILEDAFTPRETLLVRSIKAYATSLRTPTFAFLFLTGQNCLRWLVHQKMLKRLLMARSRIKRSQCLMFLLPTSLTHVRLLCLTLETCHMTMTVAI